MGYSRVPLISLQFIICRVFSKLPVRFCILSRDAVAVINGLRSEQFICLYDCFLMLVNTCFHPSKKCHCVLDISGH